MLLAYKIVKQNLFVAERYDSYSGNSLQQLQLSTWEPSP